MHLTLHLTGRCNLRCRYCYAAPHRGGDMSLDTVKAAIRLAMEAAKQEQTGQGLGLIFFGGEPLLMRNLIAETVRYCRQIEAKTGQLFHFKMTTNGMLLDTQFLTDLDTSEIFIALSRDGIKEAHDTHRVDAAGNGAFERIDEISLMLLQYKPYTPAMVVVTPETTRYYSESIEYLFNKGFRYLICSLDYSADWQEKHLVELRKQYRKLADWYFKATVNEEKFYFSPFEVKIASHVYPGSCLAERCELGKRQISVAPNGRLYPCVQFVGDGTDMTCTIGHVETGIDEEARARLYAINAKEKDTCAACAIRDRCNHYCGCLNKQATGKIDRVSPMLCAHERIVLPIADRVAAKLFKRRDPLFIQKHYNDLFPLISLVDDATNSRGVDRNSF